MNLEFNYPNHDKVIELCFATSALLQIDMNNVRSANNYKRTITMTTLLVNTITMVEMLRVMRTSENRLVWSIERVLQALEDTYDTCNRYDRSATANGDNLIEVWNSAKVWANRQDSKANGSQSKGDITNLFTDV
jgi:hypothetical protein